MDQQDYDYNNEEYEYEEEGNEDVDSPEYVRGYSNDEPVQESPYEIMPLARLYEELETILRQIQGIIYMDLGWCLVLLKEFKWDKDYLKEEYYNRNEEYLKKVGFKADLSNTSEMDRGYIGTCDICISQDVPIYYNICGHHYCLDCWFSHVKNCIQSSSPFPRCMDEDCPTPMLLETVVGLLKLAGEQGESWLKKYEKKLCELFITTNRNYQFCTGVDCGNCIKVNTHNLDTVTCFCGKVFCFRCQSDDHYPCKCDEKAKWAEQVLKEEADAKWISNNAKICPSCKKAVERSMGCNFMACVCGKNFCYMCSGPWQPDHKDHFKCHIYKKKADQIVNRQKQIMERMNHCTERYIFNQAVANNYKEIDVFAKRKYLFKTLRIELTESEFMESAFKFAIECCEKLKWIYAFTYFHDMGKQMKDTFEFSLGEYEKYKENLLKLLAADLKKFMTAVESSGELSNNQIIYFNEQFKALKKQIVNFYTCTKNYKDKFVQQLNNITELMNKELEDEELKKYQQEVSKGNSLPLMLTKSKSKNEEKKGFLEKIGIKGKKKN